MSIPMSILIFLLTLPNLNYHTTVHWKYVQYSVHSCISHTCVYKTSSLKFYAGPIFLFSKFSIFLKNMQIESWTDIPRHWTHYLPCPIDTSRWILIVSRVLSAVSVYISCICEYVSTTSKFYTGPMFLFSKVSFPFYVNANKIMNRHSQTLDTISSVRHDTSTWILIVIIVVLVMPVYISHYHWSSMLDQYFYFRKSVFFICKC